eukprot:2256649-Rhodomonas_salina.1
MSPARIARAASPHVASSATRSKRDCMLVVWNSARHSHELRAYNDKVYCCFQYTTDLGFTRLALHTCPY